MGQFFKAAKAADVASGKLRCVEIGGRRIALFSLGDEIYALDDLCTHESERLSEGTMDRDEIACPLHKARFNVRTGQSSTGQTDTIERYNVRIADGDVEIEI